MRGERLRGEGEGGVHDDEDDDDKSRKLMIVNRKTAFRHHHHVIIFIMFRGAVLIRRGCSSVYPPAIGMDSPATPRTGAVCMYPTPEERTGRNAPLNRFGESVFTSPRCAGAIALLNDDGHILHHCMGEVVEPVVNPVCGYARRAGNIYSRVNANLVCKRVELRLIECYVHLGLHYVSGQNRPRYPPNIRGA